MINFTKTAAKDLQAGQEVSVILGVATAHCAIGVSSVHGCVSRVSEKAVQITEDNLSIWLPKKALVNGHIHIASPSTRRFDLAKWFYPEGYTARILRKMTSHSSLVA